MRNKLLVVFLVLVGVFYCGRYSVTREGVKKIDIKTETKDTETKKVTTITKNKEGEVKTVIVEDTKSKTKDVSKAVSIASPGKTINISLLAAYNFKEPGLPIYGIMVSKQVFGPVTAGVFGLTNGTLGVSVGMEF